MPAVKEENNTLFYKGSAYLRQRLLLSILSGKSVRITHIRHLDDDPGLQEFEVSLIRLLDKVTNGTIIELNETGTALYFQPGLIQGGTVDHNCALSRGIGYYLEALLYIGLFCKSPLNVTLKGVTSNLVDPSVDHIKASFLPVLKRFILDDEGLNIKITKRGMRPEGGGEVIFQCPVQKQLRPIQLTDGGMVKRIRGISYALRVSPAIANRMVDSAKGVLLNFIPDVYINTDQCRGKQSGKSPGFGINLIAETTNSTFYSVEQVSNVASEGTELSIPEDLGAAAAHKLLQQVYLGGCTDSASQSLALLFMALGQKDVSKIVLGSLTDYAIAFLQHLREFFGVTFKIQQNVLDEADENIVRGADKVNLTCVGIGYSNLNKRVI